MAEARQALVPVRGRVVRWRRGIVRWQRRAAAAALLVAVLGGSWLLMRPPVPQAVVVNSAPGDVDASGRVDIVDAYTLALRLRRGEPLDTRFDFSGDGRVDSRDVDWVAKTSVMLARRTP